MTVVKRIRGLGRTVALALSLGALMAIGTANAGTLDDVKARGKLVVGVKTDYPPFGYIDSSGDNAGFDIDLAHAFAKALFGDEAKVEFVSVTSGNRIPFLQSKKIDIIMASVTITDERAKVVDFAQPYFYAGNLILVRQDSPISGVADLAGKSVAVIQGSGSDTDVAELAPTARRTKYGNASEAVLALRTKRVDAYVHDDILILTLARQTPDMKSVGKVFRALPLGIAVRKGDTDFRDWVDKELESLRKNGTFDLLAKKDFGDITSGLTKP